MGIDHTDHTDHTNNLPEVLIFSVFFLLSLFIPGSVECRIERFLCAENGASEAELDQPVFWITV